MAKFSTSEYPLVPDGSGHHSTLLIDLGLRNSKSIVTDACSQQKPLYEVSYRSERHDGLSMRIQRGTGYDNSNRSSHDNVISTGVVAEFGNIVRYSYCSREVTLQPTEGSKSTKTQSKSYNWTPGAQTVHGEPKRLTWQGETTKKCSSYKCLDEYGARVAEFTIDSSIGKGKTGRLELIDPLASSDAFRDEILTTCILVVYPSMLRTKSKDRLLGSISGFFSNDEDVAPTSTNGFDTWTQMGIASAGPMVPLGKDHPR